MKCPEISDLPLPPEGKEGWPWTGDTPLLAGQKVWPRVSIVTPCFNSGLYLEESIRSVLLQGYPDLEYIIMDGGSSDDSAQIIKKYERWLAHWESKPDRGQSHAINKGLEISTGMYFNWQNADDILLPGNVFQTVLGFDDHPDASYLCRHRLLLDESGVLTPKHDDMSDMKVNEKLAFIRLSAGFQPGGLMRRDFVIGAGGVDESLHIAMDEDLQLRLMMKGPAYYLADPGVIFRTHAGQKTQAMYKTRKDDKFRVFHKIYDGMPDSDPRYQYRRDAWLFANHWAAQLCRQNGNYALWLKYSLQAFLAKVEKQTGEQTQSAR